MWRSILAITLVILTFLPAHTANASSTQIGAQVRFLQSAKIDISAGSPAFHDVSRLTPAHDLQHHAEEDAMVLVIL